MAVVTMKQLLEAGVHFGHQTRRWNPKMRRFIFGERNGIYIVDLHQTLDRIDTAYRFVRDTVADGGTVLFVGTKKQAQEPVERQAQRSGMPYINFRWLGGMLTNFQTVHARVAKLRELQRVVDSGEIDQMPKKEGLKVRRDLAKLDRNLGGIKNLEKLPERRLRDRHEEGAHRGHRGEPLEDPGRRGRRHELRPRHHRLRDPRQRRRDPFRAADVPRDRRRGDRGQAHRSSGATRVRAHAPKMPRRPAAPARPQRTAEEERAHQEQQAEARAAAAAQAARDRGAGPGREGRQGPHPKPNPNRNRLRRLRPRRPPRPRRKPRPKPLHKGEKKTMADISAKDVAALRKVTGAGMMDCKRALEETGGDIDAAKDWLREKGLAGAAKRAGREADQGAIEVLVEGTRRRARRAELRDRLRRQGRRLQGAPLAGLTRLVVDRATPTSATQSLRRRDRRRVRQAALAGTLGEKIELGRVVRFETTDGLLDGYKHIQNERGTVGVLVELGGVDARRRPGARGRARHRAAHRQRGAALRRPRRRPGRRGRARARRSSRRRRAKRASPSRRWPRSSRASSTASSRPSRCSSRRFVKDQKTTIEALVDEPRRRRDRPAVRPRQDRRGVATPHRPRGVADAREPVPPSGAQAFG